MAGADQLALRPLHRAFLHTLRSPGVRMLMRDWILHMLYHPTEGYYTRFHGEDNLLYRCAPFDFPAIRDKQTFLEDKDFVEGKSPTWFTPVELCKPYYGRVLADYMLQTRDPARPLRIYEVGGGSGVLAASVLDYLAAEHPAVYAEVRYVGVELSEPLHRTQRELLARHRERGRYEALYGNFLDWRADVTEDCYVVLHEVLDCLPHDRVVNHGPRQPPAQTYVEIPHRDDRFGIKEQKQFILHALSDGPILETLAYDGLLDGVEFVGAGRATVSRERDFPIFVSEYLNNIWWVPTAYTQLCHVLHRHFPKHRLLAIDISRLPPERRLEGMNAPRIQAKVMLDWKGEYEQHNFKAIFSMLGRADVVFPVDFHSAERLYRRTQSAEAEARRDVRVTGLQEFFEQYGGQWDKQLRLGDGTSVLGDYSYYKVLTSLPT